MPSKKVGTFSVSHLQILNERGIAATGFSLPPAEVKELYEHMIFSRTFDEKCLALQRQGRMGTFASGRGQEAAHVGSATALHPDDWMFPAFRENAANLVRGIPPENVMAYWAGDERGDVPPKGVNNFTVSIPVATQIPHAVGVAWGMKLRKERSAALVYFGDGATSKGDFHESMNFAGVFSLPIVFLCMNNQFAISLPVSKQTASKTLAQKAIAYGFEGIRVDGNDVFAMHQATTDALKKARSGRGPTLIEALTYRIEHHTTADDSWRYRTKKEVAEWQKKDPIDRLEKYMRKKKLLTDQYAQKVKEEVKRRVEAAVSTFEHSPKPKPEAMFDHVFKELPQHLEDQKKEVLDEIHGDQHD